MWNEVFAVSPLETGIICGFGASFIIGVLGYGLHLAHRHFSLVSKCKPLYDSPTVEADQVRTGYSLEDSRVVPDLLSDQPVSLFIAN